MSRSFPYRARTLAGATKRVRRLQKMLREYGAEMREMVAERRALAKLAAEGPAFHNPLEAMAAERLRDRILAHECGLKHDGSPLAPIASR